ncbi:hypothetical protein ACH5RR_038676 [Cinchona calisaya]|uniref:Uncharacterized protein n=1 Tax=Cinchona calisaya TaxID=153742 RepID=A0ABD2XXB0_9GENT
MTAVILVFFYVYVPDIIPWILACYFSKQQEVLGTMILGEYSNWHPGEQLLVMRVINRHEAYGQGLHYIRKCPDFSLAILTVHKTFWKLKSWQRERCLVVKPCILKHEKQKVLKDVEKSLSQHGYEPRAAADKAQQLLQNVANGKRSRQLGNRTKKCYRKPPVTLTLAFLVNEPRQLKL